MNRTIVIVGLAAALRFLADGARVYILGRSKERGAQALRYLEEAFKQGYGDYYNIYFENDSPISLEPLRSDPDFRMLVQQYSSIF